MMNVHRSQSWIARLVLAILLLGLASPAPTVKASADVGTDRYLVGFRSAADADSVIQSTALKGFLRHRYANFPAVALELSTQARQQLLSDPRVAYMEPDASVRTAEMIPDNIKQVKADHVQAQGNYGAGIPVAVIDTGVGSTLDLSGVEQVAFGNLPAAGDDNGHGTHVAGILAAQLNGVGIVGTAPGVRLFSLKALGADGTGNYSDIVAALDWAISHHVRIVNMSFGGSQYSQALEQAVMTAYHHGMLLVAAAGNDGMGADTILYPARFSSVIAVGAVDANNQRASFSSVGSQLELMAPGVNIYSTLPGDLYGYASGTSAAAPHVSGIAALVWASRSRLTNAEVRQLLSDTARPLGDVGLYGHGLVDAESAVAASLLPPGTWRRDRANPGIPGQVKDHTPPHGPPQPSRPLPPGRPLSARGDVNTQTYATNQPIEPPAIPNLYPDYYDSSSIDLVWSSSGADWFELDRWNTTLNQWDIIYTGTATSYRDTQLPPADSSGARSYHVFARNFSGVWSGSSFNGGYVAVFTGTTPQGSQVPTIISSTSSYTTVTVPASSGVYFQFLRSVYSSTGWSAWQTVQSGSNNSYTDYGITNNSCCSTYWVWVQQSSGAWWHGSEPIVGGPPSLPTSLASTGITSSSISLSWGGQTSSLGDGSIAYHCQVNGSDINQTTSSTACTISGLQSNTTYSVGVYAVNAFWGQSDRTSITVRTSGASGSGYQYVDAKADGVYMGGNMARYYASGYPQQYYLQVPTDSLPSTWQQGSDYFFDGNKTLIGTRTLQNTGGAAISTTPSQVALTVTDSGVIAAANPVTVADVSTQTVDGTAPYNFVLVAGILSQQDFFDTLKQRLIGDYTVNAVAPQLAISFPYGYVPATNFSSWQRVLLAAKQIAKVTDDATTPPQLHCWGCQTVLNDMGTSISGSGKLVFIGHSGGAVAAYRSFQLWKSQNCCLVDRSNVSIFAYGSPGMILGGDHDLVHDISDSNDWIPTLIGYLPFLGPATTDHVSLTPRSGLCCSFEYHVAYFDDNGNLDKSECYLAKYLGYPSSRSTGC